jgi:hypothetical protein
LKYSLESVKTANSKFMIRNVPVGEIIPAWQAMNQGVIVAAFTAG